MSKIPVTFAMALGIEPDRTTRVRLADSSAVERGEAEAQMELLGRRKWVPLTIGPDGELPLLGLTSLESFKLKVDPSTQSLEPSEWIEYSAN